MFKKIFALIGLALSATACTSSQTMDPHERRTDVALEQSAPSYSKSFSSPCHYSSLSTDNRFALLIGVSEYTNVTPLEGPKNDVALLYHTLIDAGWASSNICVLADSLDKSVYSTSEILAELPTRSNIDLALRELADVSNDQTQVILYLSGHGSYMPDSERDGSPVEPDGTDEFFIPIDIESWQGASKRVQNALIDDDIEQYIISLQERGAFVWMIADFCHSGFSSRNEIKRRNLSETERLTVLGIPQETSNFPYSSNVNGIGSAISFQSDRLNMNKFVGFYASQSNEPTFEFPVRFDEANNVPVYHGLLTWHLIEILRNRASSNYKSIASQLKAAYWGWGKSRVTPVFDGRTDIAPMIGADGDNIRSISRDDAGELIVQIGGLEGAQLGSRIAILNLLSDELPQVGTAEIVDVDLLSSRIKFVETPSIPDLRSTAVGRSNCGSNKQASSTACRIINKSPQQPSILAAEEDSFRRNWYRFVGARIEPKQVDFSLSISILEHNAREEDTLRLEKSLREIARAGDGEFGIRFVDEHMTETPDYYLHVSDRHVIFSRNPGDQNCAKTDLDFQCAKNNTELAFALNEATSERIERVLRNLAKAKNLLRLANSLGTTLTEQGLTIELAVANPLKNFDGACHDANAVDAYEREASALENTRRKYSVESSPPTVGLCDVVGLKLSNSGPVTLDITALYVNNWGEVYWLRNYPNYTIGALRIAPGETFTLSYTEQLQAVGPMRVAIGPVSLVVISSEADEYKDYGPKYDWLEQLHPEAASAMRSDFSPLGNLLQSGAFGIGNMRSAPDNIGAIGVIQYDTKMN